MTAKNIFYADSDCLKPLPVNGARMLFMALCVMGFCAFGRIISRRL